MKCKSFLAIVLALAMFTAVPTVFTDDSDAATATTGEQGIGYSVKNLSTENMNKLLNDAAKEDLAEDVLDKFLYDTSNFTITEITVSEYSESVYRGMKVAGTTVTDIQARSESYKIVFKATTDTAGETLFSNLESNLGMLKEVGLENKTQSAAYFNVTAVCKLAGSEESTSEYTANSSAQFVLTKEIMTGSEVASVKADVKYTFTSSGDPKTIEGSYVFDNETTTKLTTIYDFNGKDLTTVTSTDKCIRDRSIDSMSYKVVNKCTMGGNSYGQEVSIGDNNKDLLEAIMMGGANVVNATVVTTDLQAPEYSFYGTGDNALFTGTSVATELQDNDAMKAFLKGAGTIVESFSAAKSGSDSIYNDASGSSKNNTTLYIAIGAIAAVAVVGGLLFLRFRH